MVSGFEHSPLTTHHSPLTTDYYGIPPDTIPPGDGGFAVCDSVAAVAAATLATAPLLYFNHNARSLEAAWEYLLIGSVGIALALLGSLFLAYSGYQRDVESTLLFDQ